MEPPNDVQDQLIAQQISQGRTATILLETRKSQLGAMIAELAKLKMLSEQTKLENLTEILKCQCQCLQDMYAEAPIGDQPMAD